MHEIASINTKNYNFRFYLNRFLMLSKIDFLSALSALKFSHSLNFFTSSFSSLFRVLGM